MPAGSAYKRKDGRWELYIITGKTLDGKRIKKSFYGNTSREVKEKRDEWLEKQARNELTQKSIGFSEWALKWAEAYKKGKVKSSTYQYTYLHYINDFFSPYFNDTKLSDIKKIDVVNFFNMHNDNSSAVKHKMKVILNQIFEEAIENDLCVKNPVKGYKIGEYEKVIKKNTYNESQYNTVIDYLNQLSGKEKEAALCVFILLKTGVRKGELLALDIDRDFDLEKNILHITRAVTIDGEKNNYAIGKPKSKSANRYIPYDDELSDYLKACKITGLLFKNIKNSFYDPANWSERIYRPLMQSICEKLNKGKNESDDNYIPYLSPHELRHSYGTMLRRNGVDIYTIQKVMGHADISTTASIYVHNEIDTLKDNMHF